MCSEQEQEEEEEQEEGGFQCEIEVWKCEVWGVQLCARVVWLYVASCELRAHAHDRWQ